MSYPRTIVVDFDGVIHQYTSPWTTPQEINDPPMPGAFDWLRERMTDGWQVIVFSSRLPEGYEAMLSWFRAYAGADLVDGKGDSETLKFHFGGPKPMALVYLDDRAIRFRGRWPTAAELEEKPWKIGQEVASPPQIVIVNKLGAPVLEIERDARISFVEDHDRKIVGGEVEQGANTRFTLNIQGKPTLGRGWEGSSAPEELVAMHYVDGLPFNGFFGVVFETVTFSQEKVALTCSYKQRTSGGLLLSVLGLADPSPRPLTADEAWAKAFEGYRYGREETEQARAWFDVGWRAAKGEPIVSPAAGMGLNDPAEELGDE